MTIQTKQEILKEYKRQELILIKSLINPDDCDKINVLKDLKKCRDTIKSLSDVYDGKHARIVKGLTIEKSTF